MNRKEIERETKTMYSILSSEVTDEVGATNTLVYTIDDWFGD